MQVSITSIKILGHYILYLENPHLNYQHFRKSDRADALDPSIKQELSERSGETWAKRSGWYYYSAIMSRHLGVGGDSLDSECSVLIS